MIQINVALMNGDAEFRLPLPPSSTVQDLRTRAQQAFGKKYLRLMTAKNQVLVDFEQTLEEAEIEDGECLTALVLQPQLAATGKAFALWCHGDSAVVTWGHPHYGGDTSAVQDQLRGLQQIQATGFGAFAAILEDGSVVTWGDAGFGGDSRAVQDQLKGVQQIQSTGMAFAAILEDGSVVTFGRPGVGGDSSAVRDQLKGVRQIQASHGAFAAILEDGSVVTWGHAGFGGDSSEVQDQLKGVCVKNAMGSASRGEQMQVLLLLGHIKLAQVCSGSVLYENFRTQIEVFHVYPIWKKCVVYPKLVAGAFQWLLVGLVSSD